MWVYPTMPAAKKHALFTIYRFDDYLIYMYYDSKEQSVKAFADIQLGSHEWDVTSGAGKVPLKKWTMVCLTLDYQYVRMYVNGAKVTPNVRSIVASANTIPGPSVYIGKFPFSSLDKKHPLYGSEGFTGRIDEVAVFKTVLSDVEIRALHGTYPKPKP